MQNNPITRIFVLVMFSLSLGGCFWVAAGGEGGYIAAQDNRTASETLEDQLLFTKVKAALAGASNVSSGNIEVTVRKSIVTLRGAMASGDEKTRALAATKNVDGVKGVVDKLAVIP